jgi:hypothetical protein
MNGCQPDGSRRTAFRAAQPRVTSRQPRASHVTRRSQPVSDLVSRRGGGPRSGGYARGRVHVVSATGSLVTRGRMMTQAPAGRHAGGMREPAGQPGRTRQCHRRMRSLMRATRHDVVHGTRAIARSPLARARSRSRRRPNRAVPSGPCNSSRASGLKQSTCALSPPIPI